ncbi:MAG: cupredoxin domain-containing protein [Terriglobia bacterium]
MKLKRAFSIFFVLAAVLTASAFGQEQQAANPAPHEIQMTAKKYEFNPNVITVKKGERVKLVITATDHEHGFKLEDFKIDQPLKKGAPTTVEFTADKVGEFHFHCSHFCGLGHPKMKGKLVVTE